MFNKSITRASKCLTVCRYSAPSSEGRINEDVQSLIFSFAATAVAPVFLGGKVLDSWSFL